MGFRINWKSCSQWQGTKQTEQEGEEVFETREEAEAALAELEKDSEYMSEVHSAAIQGQGVEGWIEVEEDE